MAGAEMSGPKRRELALQRVLVVWIVTGLAFMVLPGTLLGAWNLIVIAGERTASDIDPSWLQAHGHAQIFGWIGSFIIGIGYYSLSKMGGVPAYASHRAWVSWTLWTTGVSMRWIANVWHFHWRWLLPVSAVLELIAFALFFVTVSRHKPTRSDTDPSASTRPAAWIITVAAGSVGFILALLVNAQVAFQVAFDGTTPAIAHGANQRMLILMTAGFPVLTIWGFSARWLPVFLGLRNPNERLLLSAVAITAAGVASALASWWVPATIALLLAAVLATLSVRVFERSIKPPKTSGVHPWFPAFVRIAYGWLVVSCIIGVGAALWDRAGGLWGSSRHALTVGFMAAMVFSIGQRVLPGFSGRGALFSPRLMLASLLLLNVGCLLRVGSEIGAYESYAPYLWPLLPVSAVIEICAVIVFASNLALTLRQRPVHLRVKDWELVPTRN